MQTTTNVFSKFCNRPAKSYTFLYIRDSFELELCSLAVVAGLFFVYVADGVVSGDRQVDVFFRYWP